MTDYIEVTKDSIAWRDDELRPEWLGDGVFAVRVEHGTVNLHTGSDFGWHGASSLCLPRTHWAAPAIEGGWRPWAGGDAAPDDWDGGEVLWGTGYTCRPSGDDSWSWAGWENSSARIIGYKPKPPVSQVSPELVERMVALVRKAAQGQTAISDFPEARAIMAELEPPDPLESIIAKRLEAFCPNDLKCYRKTRGGAAIFTDALRAEVEKAGGKIVFGDDA